MTLTVTAESVAAIALDPQRVRQVISNLISNALRHTPSGGRVSVDVADSPERVTIAVTDTGSGMTPEDVERAFDRFWRADGSAGAGLGLAIVRDLVRAHGGDAAIQSTPGRGTTVVCSFPREASAAQGSSATAR